MLVSIITITYNSEKTLEQTLQSVAQQTYPHIEHIIIDGASTDGTHQIIERYREHIAAYISEPDSGIYEAINKGIALATGDVVGILNSDDVFASPHTIAHIVRAFQSHDTDVVYGDLEYCDMERKESKQLVRQWKSNTFRHSDLKYGWMPPHPTLYCRKEVFAKYGQYNMNFRISGDYDFMLRIFKDASLRSYYLPEVLVRMRVGGISNRDLKSICKKMSEDYRVIRANRLTAFTLLSKNIRKITQFIHFKQSNDGATLKMTYTANPVYADKLNVSIVLYNPQKDEVDAIVHTLLQATSVHQLYLIDNSLSPSWNPIDDSRIQYIFVGKNVGYGSGHNIALRKTLEQGIPYHLVINSDIQLDHQLLSTFVTFMNQHPNVGSMMPKVVYPNGDLQYLCKLLPSPLDLFGRRFLPPRWIEKRMQRFELHQSGYNKIMNVPFLSGCFMFLRTEALAKVGLFDERYFIYSEDIDLTRRIHQKYQTLFYPNATITHAHAAASYKSLKYLFIHIVNLCRYFNKWGWVFDKERRRINADTLQQCR